MLLSIRRSVELFKNRIGEAQATRCEGGDTVRPVQLLAKDANNSSAQAFEITRALENRERKMFYRWCDDRMYIGLSEAQGEKVIIGEHRIDLAGNSG